MTLGVTAPARPSSNAPFRPESLSHFKDVAKNLAWLLDRPLQKCQEHLARIYGYSGSHELLRVLRSPGEAGPFEPRYAYLGTEAQLRVELNERRIFQVLFGEPQGYWRDGFLCEDKCFLVFEMGLFQEASEHRACVEKIKHVLTYGHYQWPLMHGWPLGLRAWLAAGYTEPFELVSGWQKRLPKPRYSPIAEADIRRQRRRAGLTRLAQMFTILAPRVGGRKPRGMGKVKFRNFDDEGCSLDDSSWEQHFLMEWLVDPNIPEVSRRLNAEEHDALLAFAQRPSIATASACEFTKHLADPIAFRDRWAFECFKATHKNWMHRERALFESTASEGFVHSLLLLVDDEGLSIGDTYGAGIWQLTSTLSAVVEAATKTRPSEIQPVVHATGSLIIPVDSGLQCMTSSDWLLLHDASDFAAEEAAVAFENVYLPAIGVHEFEGWYKPPISPLMFGPDVESIIEIDEIVLASGADPKALRSFFLMLIESFGDKMLPDSHGYWGRPLSLCYEDQDLCESMNENGENADYVYAPGVLLINVEGCGLSFVRGRHSNGEIVSVENDLTPQIVNLTARSFARMIIDATADLSIDVVVYDAGREI